MQPEVKAFMESVDNKYGFILIVAPFCDGPINAYTCSANVPEQAIKDVLTDLLVTLNKERKTDEPTSSTIN